MSRAWPSWSYGQLAKVVGCSPELIAVIIKDKGKGTT